MGCPPVPLTPFLSPSCSAQKNVLRYYLFEGLRYVWIERWQAYCKVRYFSPPPRPVAATLPASLHCSSWPLSPPHMVLAHPSPCTSALELFSVLQSLWAPSVWQRAGLSQWGEEPEQSSLAAAPCSSLGHWMSAALLTDLQTMPLLFLFPALAPTSHGRAQGTRCSLFPKGFFVAEDLDVLFVPPGQAPADFESVSSCFSYPLGLPASWMKAGPVRISTSPRQGSTSKTTTPGRDSAASWDTQLRFFQGQANSEAWDFSHSQPSKPRTALRAQFQVVIDHCIII